MKEKIINKNNIIRNSEKGAITLYVLLACLFFVFTLTGVYTSNLNRLKAQEQDIKQIQENYARELKDIDNVYEEMKSPLKVGDYINYVPDENTTGYSKSQLTSTITGSTSNTSTITQDKQYTRDGEGMTWQILRIHEDGSIDLIGSPTTQAIHFKGANGYNNGVTVMNDICETLYSNEKLNATARSVNYKDLEYWLTDKGKTVRDEYLAYSGGPAYGHTQTYTSSNYRYYPNLYAQEIGAKIDSGLSGLTAGIDKETGNIKGLEISDKGTATSSTRANTSLTVTQTYWYNSVDDTNLGEGYNALKTSGSYWVASRYVNCSSNNAIFGLQTVNNFLVGGVFVSTNYSIDVSDYLRPVVSLSPNVQIENCTGKNSITNMHTIIQ